MKITIDNLDGNGALDYTGALSATVPLKIVRRRRTPAQASGALDLNAAPLPVPSRYTRVIVANDNGAVLFSGTLNTQPERIYAGAGTKGAVYTLAFAATGDTAPDATDLLPETAQTHSFRDGDGVLELAAPAADASRQLAADITLTGETEPTAYITESFLGDGATAIFDLTQPPFRPGGSATLLDERFDRPELSPRLWSTHDPGGVLTLTSAGLTVRGGSGLDGSATLVSAVPLEIAGTLVLVSDGVVLNPGSDGVLCGLYRSNVSRNSCMAGFSVRQANGATVVTPLVDGSEAGSSLTVLNGHRYRLRLRLHCPESVRLTQSYGALVEGELRSFGGDAIPAPLTLLFEVQDLGLASNTPATVLHTATIASSPATCSFAPVNSAQLFGSIAGVSVTQGGSAWITSTSPDGSVSVRMTGELGDGVDCALSTQGRITFFSGRIPLANEIVTVSYRARQRAVARLMNAAAHADGDAPLTAMWQGRITHPPARTSVDCANAARAALAFASARSATLSGSYTVINARETIAPGDMLTIASTGDTLRLMARTVTITCGLTVPETITWHIDFANDWSRCLGAELAANVAEDALLPLTATAAPAPVLANLPALAVVSSANNALQIDAGATPPIGGGFEVRRRDWAFGPSQSSNVDSDTDLVLRSPVRSFVLPRSAPVERFFVRMYDGSNPPVYSRFSSAIFTRLPLSS